MKWVNLDAVRLASHMAVFRIHRNDLAFKTMSAALADADSANVELIARRLIEEARPTLKNCTVFYIGFDAGCAALEIGVEHPSLPEIRMGECADIINLHVDIRVTDQKEKLLAAGTTLIERALDRAETADA